MILLAMTCYIIQCMSMTVTCIFSSFIIAILFMYIFIYIYFFYRGEISSKFLKKMIMEIGSVKMVKEQDIFSSLMYRQ